MNIHEMALPKASLQQSEITALTNTATVRATVRRNIDSVMGTPHVLERRGIFQEDNFQSLFTFSGGLYVASLGTLGVSARHFINQREGRAFKNETTGKYNLRGPRYIAALDTNLSASQRMQITLEDYDDGVAALRGVDVSHGKQHMEASPILDYVKATAIAAFHTHVHAEHTGEYQTGNGHYQEKRKKLILHVQKTVEAYYKSLVGDLTTDDLSAVTNPEQQTLIHSVLQPGLYDLNDATFMKKSFLRTELEHPLVILAAAQMAVAKYPEKDTIIGTPTGSTELSAAITAAYLLQANHNVNLVLIPLSNGLRRSGNGKNFLQKIYDSNRESIVDKNVLIVDDNSSTGTTMQMLAESILSVGQPHSIDYLVAEADIIRSQIGLHDPRRTHIANSELYNSSVGVLPVSRTFHPKHSLRKISEQIALSNYYRQKAKNAISEEETIKFAAFARSVRHPSVDLLKKTRSEDRIDSFRDTWLSNFVPVQVTYDEVEFPSVEHAYQYAKFGDSLSRLSLVQKQGIGNILTSQGVQREVKDVSSLFTDPTIRAGIIKRISSLLEGFGLGREDWADIKIDVMTNLLVQKYAQQPFTDLLLETNDKVLIEGNTWNDTFWGVCNERGSNMLGNLLMSIRENLLSKNQ